MSSKNMKFAADLAASVEPQPSSERVGRAGSSILNSRNNRLADLAAGSVVNNQQELVDPARCRIWHRHNRDYTALTPERCNDLIESITAQGKQEVPAIVRRLSGDPDFDYEVICGARRHWAVTWLRSHNYPDIRYLVEVRNLTDEQAFRVSDLENRARVDLSDVERARDYLKALDLYYDGKQKAMAARLNQSEAWLSRYLDLARLPEEIIAAFADPLELKINHIGVLKPILKPEESRGLVLAEAGRISDLRERGEEGVPTAVLDVLRALVAAASKASKNPEKKAAPKKTGLDAGLYHSEAGVPLLRVEKKDRKGLNIQLLTRGGGSKEDVERAFKEMLAQHWPS
ncbi:ParB/RepB/Spo0J family partition protein [Novosphingobium rosa]|uniref:ParB/RepB/Spo0J family partition protein n=1 Tax=Novosphingobium rosa TaxID=76978 RepID=UPI000831D0D7|nr:ParB/RepB/Spo0J family partition protein [Novosphingobium rosa]